MRHREAIFPHETSGRLLHFFRRHAEEGRVLQQTGRDVFRVVRSEPRRNDAARGLPGHGIRTSDGLGGKRLEGCALRSKRVERRIMRRFAMAETVHGEHVVALCQVRQCAGVIFPLRRLAVHQQERRAVVGALGVVDDGRSRRPLPVIDSLGAGLRGCGIVFRGSLFRHGRSLNCYFQLLFRKPCRKGALEVAFFAVAVIVHVHGQRHASRDDQRHHHDARYHGDLLSLAHTVTSLVVFPSEYGAGDAERRRLFGSQPSAVPAVGLRPFRPSASVPRSAFRNFALGLSSPGPA